MLLYLTIRLFVDWLQLIDWSQGMLASCRNYEDGKDADVSCLLVLTQLPSWGWLTGERISLNTPTAGGDDDAALSEWALTTSECSVSVWWADTALLSRLCNLFTYYQHILRSAYQPPQCYLLRDHMTVSALSNPRSSLSAVSQCSSASVQV